MFFGNNKMRIEMSIKKLHVIENSILFIYIVKKYTRIRKTLILSISIDLGFYFGFFK
jgi:hypothetical protein